MRLPGLIPAGKVVTAPVSNLAMFATITDYLGIPGHAPATSLSLRPLVEGNDALGKERVVFSFWDTDIAPGYMAYDGRFKLMIGREAKARLVDEQGFGLVDEQGFDAPGVDALYDLQYDPKEETNLLRTSYVKKPLSALHPDITPGSKGDLVPLDQATRLQTALVQWLHNSGSEYAKAVKARIMNITHINQAPVLAKPMKDAIWTANKPGSLPMPNGTFFDIDGNTLHYTGLLDRKAFPSWLKVDSASGELHGTPPTKGTHLVRLIASDDPGHWGAAFAEFQLVVA
jgi:hypothetical protein